MQMAFLLMPEGNPSFFCLFINLYNMKWEDYSKKHLDHIKIIFYDAQLSLRFNKHSNAYKLCEIILSKVNDTSKGSYYQTLFNVYVWCNK